ncbi:hypothetical protein AAC387_Pa12g0178 [Persea americana]
MRARRRIGDDSPLNPHTPCRAARCPPFSADRAPRARARTASLRSPGAAWECRGGGGDGWRDAQAGVPSAEWPRAQLAFKDSMVHGILQFTPSIAFRYVLHRCESRDIRCRESSKRFSQTGGGSPRRRARPRPGCARAGRGGRPFRFSIPWRSPRPKGCFGARGDARRRGRPPGRAPRAAFSWDWFAGCGSGNGNDPSAGSPTETLLRLLLPLNDKVQWTSRDVAGGEPPTSPRSEHFTGPFNR